ncbi:hypothetical protein [Cupriavidus sp. IDO]|uniref:hypothetical protein n=1 Tax=Cupriavidus sp. IDO TaxID=1539142 RepID=UPI00057988A2|nr:hypothetical protein [Cupriavidus sp. IDO]KWR87140.1 hypothetical protein RM96_26510 [Cupriavidus sp. IDO]
MPSGSHEEDVTYRGHRIHVVALRYGSQHDGWWTLRAGVWQQGRQLPVQYPGTGGRFACAGDAARAGIAWGREAIDNLIADQHEAEDAA